MRSYIYIPVIILICMALSLSSCVPAPKTENRPLEIAVDAWAGFMPVVLAAELGFFEEEGVEVRYIFSESSRQQRLEFEGGAYDGITLALGSLIAVTAKAPDTRVVLVTDLSTTGDAVLVHPDIKTIADLKGKRIMLGAAGYGEVVVTTMLEQAGLGSNDVIWVTMQDEKEALAMLEDGRIDALQIWEPFVTRAKKSGAQVIFTGADVPGLIPDAIGFHEHVLKERPEDISAFMRGWFRGVDYWLSNPEESVRIITEATELSSDELSLEIMELMTLERNREFFQKGNDFSSVYYTSTVYMDFFLRKGVLDKPIDIEQFIVPGFLETLD